MSLARRLTTNMAAAVTSRVVTAGLGVATIALMTRHLGPERFGEYRTVLVYISFATVIANLGLHIITLREMAREGADGARLVGAALGLRLVTTVVVLVLTALVVRLLPYDPVVWLGIGVAALGCLAIQGIEIVGTIFQHRLAQHRAMAAEVAGAAATLAVTLLAVLAGLGTLAMLAAFSLGFAVNLAVAVRLARPLLPVAPNRHLPTWRALALAGLTVAGSEILGMVTLRGDTLILSLLRPAEDVGIYGVATKLFELGISLPYTFAGLMMPILTRSLAAPREFPERLAHALETMAVIGIGMALGLWFFADEAVRILAGERFLAAAAPTRIVGLALVVAALAAVCRYAAIAAEGQRGVLLADLVGVIVALALYLLLIPRLSYVGAAIGTLVAETVLLLGIGLVIVRRTGTLPALGNLARILLSGLAAALVFALLEHLAIVWPLRLVGGGLVYLAALLATGGIRPAYVRALLRGGEAA